jgi:2-oxoglutarate ferredoxin oxidoreductase subunit delta
MAQGRVVIDEERCKGCGLCTTACVPGVLSLAAGRFNARGYRPAVLADPAGRCTGCALCAVICPDACLTVFRTANVRAPSRPQLAVQSGGAARKGQPA